MQCRIYAFSDIRHAISPKIAKKFKILLFSSNQVTLILKCLWYDFEVHNELISDQKILNA